MSSQNNDITDGFKMTEIGPLPNAWQVARSAEKLLLNDSGVWGNDLEEGEHGVEVLRSTNMQEGEWVFEDIANRHVTTAQFQRYRLKEGDILITKSSGSKKHIGKAAYVDKIIEDRQCVFSNFMQRLRFNDDVVYPKFAFYFIMSESGKEALLSRSTTTSGLRNLQKTDFEHIIIPLPSLPEQKAIAGVLSTIKKAVEVQDKIIAAVRELKKSLMRHLFTYGPVPVSEADKITLKETEIGPMPEHWEVKCLVETATLQRGKDLPKQNQILGQYPIVGSSGIIGYHNEFVCSGPGVVTGRSGSIGNLAYVEENYWPHNTGLYVKDFHENNPKFIYYLLHLVDFHKYATGVSVPTLNRNFVHPALVPVPSLPEQKEIARMLSAVDDKIEAEGKRKAALQVLFKTMLHLLMTGKVRVKEFSPA